MLDQTTYIEPQYYPPGLEIKDPRNMVKSEIVRFCQHVRSRQDEHGVTAAFRFTQYYNGKDLVAVEYGRRADDAPPAATNMKHRKGRHDIKKGKVTDTRPINHKKQAAPTALSPPTDRADLSQCPDVSGPFQPIQNSQPPSIIDPALLLDPGINITRGPNTTACEPNANVVVDGHQMDILANHGYIKSIPINGPNDGPPMYLVPAAATLHLRQSVETATLEPPSNHPGDMGNEEPDDVPQTINRRLRKRVMTADARAVEEAKTLVKSNIKPRRTKPDTRMTRRRAKN
jgi:hypothetical protein